MKKNANWRKLDNAAKIFPPSSSSKDPKVFRFSCELYEEVDESCLKRAVNMTLQQFPFFRSILKKGVFWYYFEETRLIPEITREHKPPCSPIYDSNNKRLLFEVSYYKRRINLEVFHALSDGTGTIMFLRALITNYLNNKYRTSDNLFQIEGLNTSHLEMTNDSFDKYFSQSKITRTKSPAAFRFKQRKYPNYQIGVVECIVPVGKVKEKSRTLGLSVTEYLISLLIDSIGENMTVRDKQKPISVSVPVNLRNYFPSKTSQNFFCVINLIHDFNTQGDSREDIIENVKQVFRETLTKDYLQERINLFASIENKMIAKLVPLFFKIPILNAANKISDRGVTAAFSNVGQIQLPPGSEKYVRRFSVFTSTEKLQVTMCSFGDDLTISFTSPFNSTEVHCSFLDRLNEIHDLDIEINTNLKNLVSVK